MIISIKELRDTDLVFCIKLGHDGELMRNPLWMITSYNTGESGMLTTRPPVCPRPRRNIS